MKHNLLLTGIVMLSFTANAQVGIKTETPQRTLHVNGSLQLTNELNVGGNASTAGNAGTAGQVLKSNGPGVAPTWQTIAGVPNATGTIIAVNGQFVVAQEISVQMTADFVYSLPSNPDPAPVRNLSNEIIDNENLFTGTATTNSFRVSSNGTYAITMNAQLTTTQGTNPVMGIWDNTNNTWVARVNDNYYAPSGGLQTYTLITSIPMLAANTYSFRVANTQSTTVKAFSAGGTGSGPVTQLSLRRLR